MSSEGENFTLIPSPHVAFHAACTPPTGGEEPNHLDNQRNKFESVPDIQTEYQQTMEFCMMAHEEGEEYEDADSNRSNEETWIDRCRSIIDKLRKKYEEKIQYVEFFMRPIEEWIQEYPAYPEVISDPIDLVKISDRLEG